MPEPILRLGTRGSLLARWQTEHVGQLLQRAWPELRIETTVLVTRGDQVLDTPLPLIGGKGLFTAELEAALHSGAIDIAVHSLKDLPTEVPPGLALGAIPQRVNPADVIVSRASYTLDTLPPGATVGTSSRRRAAQLLHHRPDLLLADIRGNLDTRIRKALDPAGPYDAIVLAAAGIERLGYGDAISQILTPEQMLPAPGQGALGIQCRDEPATRARLAPLNSAATALAVTAERAFLLGLGGGCAVPIAAYATVDAGQLWLRGRVSAVDGGTQHDGDLQIALQADEAANMAAAYAGGVALARQALAQGAAALLEALV